MVSTSNQLTALRLSRRGATDINMSQSILKSLLFVLSLSFAHVVSAYDFKVDGICYNLKMETTNDGVSQYVAEVTESKSNLMDNNSYKGDIVIPEEVVYNEIVYPVRSIGIGAFSYSDSIVSVRIGNNVTKICGSAFRECSVKMVTIPRSVVEIGECAFWNCNMQKLTLEDGDSLLTLNPYHYAPYKNAPYYARLYASPFKCGIDTLYIGRGNISCTRSYASATTNRTVTETVHPFKENKSIHTLIVGNTSNVNSSFGGCTGLQSVISQNVTPPSIPSFASETLKSAILYVPRWCSSDYASKWGFQQIVEVEDWYNENIDETEATVLLNDYKEEFTQLNELCYGTAFTEYQTRCSQVDTNRATASEILNKVSSLKKQTETASVSQEKRDSLYKVLGSIEYECDEALNWCLDKDREHLGLYDQFRQKAIQEQDRYKQRLDNCTAALETVSTLEDINRICNVLTTDIESMKQHVYDLNFAYNQFVNAGYVYETKAVLERLLKQLSDIAEELTEIETGIAALSVTAPHRIFTIQGVPVGQDGMKRLQRGIYIIDGKKAVVR